MAETTQVERLTRLETELESMKIVLLRMETKMDTWQLNFASKELLQVELKSRDEKIERLETDKTTNKNILPLWFAVIVSIAVAIWSHWH